MRINAHCHIFNLQSVFTQGTKDILADRLHRTLKDFDVLLKPVLDLLELYIEHGGGIDLRASPAERAALLLARADKARDPREASLRARLLEGLQTMDLKAQTALSGFFNELKDAFGLSLIDASLLQASDLVEFVSVGLAKDMDDVTDHLFDEMAEGQRQPRVDRGELLIFPQMMDILSRDWNGVDTASLTPGQKAARRKELDVFDLQRMRTLRQCRRYPGRVLPFYAVNPWRPRWFELFQEAMEDGGFVGMKAYPSLGYEVERIAKALEYCAAHDIPVLTHCNDGGFKARADTGDLGHPARWREVLAQHDCKGLRVCFGHFGGEEGFRQDILNAHVQWALEIGNLLRDTGIRAYADVSYHTGGMGPRVKEQYFAWLKGLLDPASGAAASRVLFGTDYFLSLARLSEDNYWDFFRDNLEERQFERIARKNPLEFLGLNPDQPDKSSANVTRHLAWLSRQRGEADWRSGDKPANWLANAAAVSV